MGANFAALAAAAVISTLLRPAPFLTGGQNMTEQTELSVEERLRQLLRHLGLDQAHFAG
jgi:hypothetical protein